MILRRKHIVFAVLFLLAGCGLSQQQTDQITLLHGLHQQFKFRYNDINVLGTAHVQMPVKESVYRLNEGDAKSFYIKGVDPVTDKISRNRLQSRGDFNIEIPVNSKDLVPGANQLTICITDSLNENHCLKMEFIWDPAPVELPLELVNLFQYESIQEIGQVVNGNFLIDHDRNVIRTQAPVAKDALLLLGSPLASQEAFYKVRFSGLVGAFIGLSDFFAGHEEAEPAIGIKPGWSTAGLATIRGTDQAARAWLAWGDLLESPEKWVVRTDPPAVFPAEVNTVYCVRHQVIFKGNINSCRFRIWPENEVEPDGWLCIESDETVSDDKIKFNKGIFGLFQNDGQPTEWFDIHLSLLEEQE